MAQAEKNSRKTHVLRLRAFLGRRRPKQAHNALYCIFSRHLVSEYPPPQIRGIGGGPDESQNDSFSRRRPRGHAKSCFGTVSSYGEAAWLRPLLLESRGLLQGSPQALSPVRRYQVRPAVRILVPQDEWNIALISAQRQGSREGKKTTTLVCDPNTSTASPTRLSHRDTLFAVEHIPFGNDRIGAHAEKRWRTSAFLHRPCEAQIGSSPFPHNRFENCFVRNPCRTPISCCFQDEAIGILAKLTGRGYDTRRYLRSIEKHLLPFRFSFLIKLPVKNHASERGSLSEQRGGNLSERRRDGATKSTAAQEFHP
ncbi:hypothetical protein ES705_06765 [subsurface metagenome]